jgi:hypothetical protein
MLHSHLDYFPNNCGMIRDEHGEHFHQEISTMEKRIRESDPLPCWLTYCLTLTRNAPEQLHVTGNAKSQVEADFRYMSGVYT